MDAAEEGGERRETTDDEAEKGRETQARDNNSTTVSIT